jgi:CheY-like chemotaxis protein
MTETCLIAAYDPWVIQLLRVFTEESGFSVVQAFEGKEVLPLVQQTQPRVILLEAELPGSPRGRDLINALTTDPFAQRVPVLIFSWQNQTGTKMQTQDSHIYLHEPVSYDDFVGALQKVGICCPKDMPATS